MTKRSPATVNHFDVIVASSRPKDSYAWLFAGRIRLAAKKWAGIEHGEKVSITIRPEDVLLSVGYPGLISARNVLAGHVRSLKRFPDGVRVMLDVGIPLVSFVTEETVAELRLKVGSEVYGIVKATAIAPQVTFRARYRVSLVGAKGLLGPDAIDFLRAVASAGSLSAAAEALGLSSRAARTRARAVSRAWERPLLALAQGGGGAELTPEGVAAVAYADRLESGQ
jgi:molybdopterin-binding protein/molybdate transport repressor ModE-like protein